jgi:hypothetical protein
MQPKIKKKLSIATIFLIFSAYGFTFNIERSVAGTIKLTKKSSCADVNFVSNGIKDGTIKLAGTEEKQEKTRVAIKKHVARCEADRAEIMAEMAKAARLLEKTRQDQVVMERERARLQQSIDNNRSATPQDSYDKNANAAARQRYLMDNQTGPVPLMRTDKAIESQRGVDRINNQIRAERGMNAARERERNAAACLYRNSDCR